MIRPSLIRLFLILSCVTLPFTNAQTDTLADPNVPGGSIVEVVTTDINGLPVTQIAQSIPPGQAATTAVAPPGAAGLTTTTPNTLVPLTTTPPVAPTTAAATRTPTTTPPAAPVQQGPVAQPAPTAPVGQGITTYQYTTIDANGQTTVIQDTFTPTYNTPSPPSSPSVGTVLGMSDWSALIGTNTSGGPTNSGESWRITWTGAGGLLALTSGFMAGVLIVL